MPNCLTGKGVFLATTLVLAVGCREGVLDSDADVGRTAQIEGVAGSVDPNPVEFQLLLASSCGGDASHQEGGSTIFWDQTTFSGSYATIVKDWRAPAVDFTANFVLAVFQGWQANCGTELSVAAIHDLGASLQVVVKATRKGAGCWVDESESYPFLLLSVHHPIEPVQIVWTNEEISCSTGVRD